MKIFRLYYHQELALPINEAWQFFSSPYHLNEITPDFFNIEIKSPVPNDIYGGLLIEYSMKAVFDIPMTWLSEISHCDRPKRFVYVQRVGPFKFWSHEVCLSEQAHGTLVEDICTYAMPFGWLGCALNKLLINKRLDKIFEKRRSVLEQRWGL